MNLTDDDMESIENMLLQDIHDMRRMVRDLGFTPPLMLDAAAKAYIAWCSRRGCEPIN